MSVSTSTQKIHGQMTIESILSCAPGKAQRLAQEMTNIGLHCAGCGAATWETLEAGVLGHGLPLATLENLIKKLNAVIAEEEDLSTISMTAKAAEKFLLVLAEEDKEGWALRFGEKLAGCSGFEYMLDFSEKAEEDDEVFESHGIEIHIKKSMLPRLLGCVIDFVEGLQNSGFKITNPNVKAACGCGSSHNY